METVLAILQKAITQKGANNFGYPTCMMFDGNKYPYMVSNLSFDNLATTIMILTSEIPITLWVRGFAAAFG